MNFDPLARCALLLIYSSGGKKLIWFCRFTRFLLSQVRVYDYDAKFAFHLWDVIAFFDQIDTYIRSPSEADYKFGDEIQQIVLNFVKRKSGISGEAFSDNKNSNAQNDASNANSNSSLWRTFPNEIANVCSQQQYNLTTIITNFHQSAQCKFWNDEGFFRYAWAT